MRFSDSGIQIARDPRESKIRETCATLLRDENVYLHKNEGHFLEAALGIVLLSGHHGRNPCCVDTEDHARRPLTTMGFNDSTEKCTKRTVRTSLNGLALELFLK